MPFDNEDDETKKKESGGGAGGGAGGGTPTFADLQVGGFARPAPPGYGTTPASYLMPVSVAGGAPPPPPLYMTPAMGIAGGYQQLPPPPLNSAPTPSQPNPSTGQVSRPPSPGGGGQEQPGSTQQEQGSSQPQVNSGGGAGGYEPYLPGASAGGASYSSSSAAPPHAASTPNPNPSFSPPGGYGTNTQAPQANGYPAAPAGFFDPYDKMVKDAAAAKANAPQYQYNAGSSASDQGALNNAAQLGQYLANPAGNSDAVEAFYRNQNAGNQAQYNASPTPIAATGTYQAPGGGAGGSGTRPITPPGSAGVDRTPSTGSGDQTLGPPSGGYDPRASRGADQPTYPAGGTRPNDPDLPTPPPTVRPIQPPSGPPPDTGPGGQRPGGPMGPPGGGTATATTTPYGGPGGNHYAPGDNSFLADFFKNQLTGFKPYVNPLQNEQQSLVQKMLTQPSPYDSELFKQNYDMLGNKLDESYGLEKKSIDEEGARRGLYDSTNIVGRLGDASIQHDRAKTDMATQLMTQRAQQMTTDQTNAVNAGNVFNAGGLATAGQNEATLQGRANQASNYDQSLFDRSLNTAKFNSGQDQQMIDLWLKMMGYS